MSARAPRFFLSERRRRELERVRIKALQCLGGPLNGEIVPVSTVAPNYFDAHSERAPEFPYYIGLRLPLLGWCWVWYRRGGRPT